MNKSKLFKSFKQFLNESPIAYAGDFSGNKVKLNNISKTILERDWIQLSITKSKRMESTPLCFISKTNTYAVLGFFKENDTSTFKVISGLYLGKFEHSGYNKTVQTSEVRTDSDYRGQGYATTLYLTLLSNGFTLVSDYNQFDGARNLWRGLQGYDIKLDLMNVCDYDITKNHKIIHTDIDSLDKEWSKFPETSGECYLFIACK